MRQLVDSTVAEVFARKPTKALDSNGRQGCGSETDDETIVYGVSIDVPRQDIDALVEAVSKRWSALGSSDDDSGSRITFPFDGFSVGMDLFPNEDRVTIGGSTKCFPPG